MKNWLIWKDPDAGKDRRQEEKGTTEDEMVGWHYWLDGHEFEQASGVGDGLGGLVCCSPWGCKELDMTEQLNWTESSQEKEKNDIVYDLKKLKGLVVEEGTWWINPDMDQRGSTAEWR